jgi:DNA-binding CsgD family transcriptional regulator
MINPLLRTGVRPATGVIAEVLDALAEGVMLVDTAARMTYTNAALDRMLREDPESGVLWSALRQCAVMALAHAPDGQGGPTWEVRTRTGWYRVRAVYVTADTEADAGRHAAAVMLERLTPHLPSLASLTARFGLSAAEARVALLLTQGCTDVDVAAKLGISPHTARHHGENVRRKIGVRYRAEVGPTVLGLMHSRCSARR